jgi:hypothetical protein
LLNIVYPPESFFYPFHLLTGIIAASIFAVILIGVLSFAAMRKPAVKKDDANQKGKSNDANEEEKLDVTDAISLGSLIITIAASGLYPFLINPVLDYEVNYIREERPNIQEYKVDLTNWGLSPANNVILSMTSSNAKFFNFTSEPFLGNLTGSNISIQGNAMYSIPILPPRSHTLVEFKVDISEANSGERLRSFVRSDERVGYHDVLWTSAFYLVLGIIIVLLFIYLVFIKKKRNLTLKKIGQAMIPIALWMFIFSLFYLSYNVGKY